MTNRFDKKAQEMDANPVIRDVALKFAQAMKTKVPISNNMDVLDYGCGSGLVAMHIYQDVHSLTMMDTSEGMLNILRDKIAHNNISNMKVAFGTIADFPHLTKSFDLIYTNNVLHHIEDLATFFHTVLTMLKPGGYFCIGDLIKENGTFHHDSTAVAHFGFEESNLRQKLANAGLKNLDWHQYNSIQKPDKDGNIQNYPSFCLVSEKK